MTRRSGIGASVSLCLAFAIVLAMIVIPPAGAADPAFGRYHALVVGNNDYRSLPKLKTAVADAEAVAKLLSDRYDFTVQLLRNASRADILRALNRYRAELTSDDNLLIYYAGHGWLDRETNTGFWQPVDAEEDDDINWIANEDLTRRLNAMLARHVMVVADSCYSGTLVRSGKTELPTARDRDAWLRRVAAKRSRTAIVSGGLEPVVDAGQGGHSVFANAFLSALRENKEAIAGGALFEKVSRPVVVNADQTPQFADIRRAGHEGGAFIFVPIIIQPSTAVAPAAAAPATQTMELAFWQSIKDSKQVGDYSAYLEQYPKGAFAALARNRLAALQKQSASASATANFGGKWVSNSLQNRFDKNERYRIFLDLKVMGKIIVGKLQRRSTRNSKRKYDIITRAITDGTSDGGTIRFHEDFAVLLGSKTEQHRRTYIGQLDGKAIEFHVQDTLGNPPFTFRATRQ